MPERAARTATGDGPNEPLNATRPQQQQRRAGIRMAYVVTLRNVTAGHRAEDVHGILPAGGIDVTADLARSLDRDYEFPPHRGGQFGRSYLRPYYESEEEG